MKNEITDYNFFSGGNAVFTLYGPEQHFTYRIRFNKQKTVLFVSVLTGPDNTNDYSYMGIFKRNNYKVDLTHKSMFTIESKSYLALNWALGRFAQKKAFPDGYGVVHQGKCCVCARPLTDEWSIENGIGPICAQKQNWGEAA